MENRQIAQELIDNGTFIIPLFPNSKKNGDVDILQQKLEPITTLVLI